MEAIKEVSPEFTPLNESIESLQSWLRFGRRYWRTFFQQHLYRKRFSAIEKHCLFIGYPRSGHTLIASLLDAHQNISISKGVDTLQYFERGFTLSQIYWLYVRQARRFTKKGCKSNGYSYLVPNQWNGKCSELKVIGDKSGEVLAERLRTRPELLDKLLHEKHIEHKFIHVIRNPFDNIATFSIRNRIDLNQAISHYFVLCETVAKARKKIDPINWIDIRHEEMICKPQPMLTQLCHFLGQEPSTTYLKDCADIVFKSPSKTRSMAPWTSSLIQRIETEIKQYPLLAEYGFEANL